MKNKSQLFLLLYTAALIIFLPFVSFFTANYQDPSFDPVYFLVFSVLSTTVVLSLLIFVSSLIAYFSSGFRKIFGRLLLTGSGCFVLMFVFAPVHQLAKGTFINLSRLVRDSDLQFIALRLHGYSPNDLANLMNEAGLLAARLTYPLVVLSAVTILFYLTKFRAFHVTLAIFAQVAVALSIPSLVEAFASQRGPVLDANGIARSQSGVNFPRPNIYYIIVDMYASYSTLKEDFEFDDADFIRSMEISRFLSCR